MIGALMYLTSSRPDIIHATCLCARYQAKPIEKHLKEVKRIFRYLWGTVNTCLWYSKDSGFELTGFSYDDYAGCKDTFKSTSGGAQFLGEKLPIMVPEEEDRVEKFIRGLPDNIYRNVIAAEPIRLQDAIRIANNLMDQKLKYYTTRNADNKKELGNQNEDGEARQNLDIVMALEAELATLRDKSHQENQGELIKYFSKLEVDHLNLQLKYQNLKDGIVNNPPTPEKDTPDFDSVFVIGKIQASLQGKDNVICQLKKQLSKLQVISSDTECTVKVRTTDSQLTKVTDPVTNLQAQNDRFRAENDKVKQHYKQLYVSIKITRAKHIEQVTKLTAENVMLKTSVSQAKVQPSVPTRTKHAVDVELIVLRLRNNMDAHLDYLRHLKESVETIRNIVEEAKVVRPLDRSIVFACRYTQRSQELLEYAIGTCPQGSQQRAKHLAHTPLIRKKQVTAPKPSDRQDRVKRCPKASGSQPKSNHKTNRISPAKGANKLPIEDLPRMNKSHLRTTNRIDSSSRLKRTNGFVERRNRTLVDAAQTMLIFSKAPMFLWTRSYFSDAWTNKLKPCTQSGSCNSLCTPTKELEILFQPMFDEYLEPPRAERPGSPTQAVQVSVTSDGVVAKPHFMEDHNVAPVDNNPFVNVFAPEPYSEASSSEDISSSESPYVSQTLHHLNKWSKDHPLDNVIGNPFRPVSTRKQLATDALWCLYSSVLSKIELKNFKSTIIEDF
nr:uncharacterized mitochondrial protein AtMg00810-like [Tanacetum cinerariifolium]